MICYSVYQELDKNAQQKINKQKTKQNKQEPKTKKNKNNRNKGTNLNKLENSCHYLRTHLFHTQFTSVEDM